MSRTVRAPRAGGVSSLVDLLARRADAQPDDRAYTFLEDGEREGATLTWADVVRRADAVAAEIRPRTTAGSRVLILCPPGLDFVPAFFGALMAGAIAVPCYPPRAGRQGIADAGADRALDRLHAVAQDARPCVVLAPSSIVDRAPAIAATLPALAGAAWVSIDGAVDAGATNRGDVSASAIAFLQYTSGSTAEPRGVMVTHANLLHNLADAHAL